MEVIFKKKRRFNGLCLRVTPNEIQYMNVCEVESQLSKVMWGIPTSSANRKTTNDPKFMFNYKKKLSEHDLLRMIFLIWFFQTIAVNKLSKLCICFLNCQRLGRNARPFRHKPRAFSAHYVCYTPKRQPHLPSLWLSIWQWNKSVEWKFCYICVSAKDNIN